MTQPQRAARQPIVAVSKRVQQLRTAVRRDPRIAQGVIAYWLRCGGQTS